MSLQRRVSHLSRVFRHMSTAMKAVRVSAFGGPEVLKVETNVPVPKVGENQVLVKVYAAGVNPVETYIRSGTYARLPQLPYTPGGDGAGVVAAVGANVTRFQVGQRVYTVFGLGSYAEYELADVERVFPLGDALTFSQGAAVGSPYFTAFRALIQKGNAKRGETVLVHGASGGVGVAAIQLAKANGLTVIGTAGTPEGISVVKRAGADHVFCHKDKDYTDKILATNNGAGVDIIVEMLANVNLVTDCRLMARNGRILVVGNRGSIEFNPRDIMPKEGSIIGVSLFSPNDSEWKEIGDNITKGIESGWVKPVIDKEYSMEEASKAHDEIINSTGAKGKIVLNIAH